MKFTMEEVRRAIIDVLSPLSDREVECLTTPEIADKILHHLMAVKLQNEITK